MTVAWGSRANHAQDGALLWIRQGSVCTYVMLHHVLVLFAQTGRNQSKSLGFHTTLSSCTMRKRTTFLYGTPFENHCTKSSFSIFSEWSQRIDNNIVIAVRRRQIWINWYISDSFAVDQQGFLTPHFLTKPAAATEWNPPPNKIILLKWRKLGVTRNRFCVWKIWEAWFGTDTQNCC